MKKQPLAIIAIILASCLLICSALADVGGVCCGTDKLNHSYTLNGNGPHDIVAVAEKQVGGTQSSLGYTGAWCAAFVNDCAKLANQSAAIPFVSGSTHAVSGLYTQVINKGGTRVSSAQQGDLVFYYCNTCGVWCHVGIMVDGSTSIEGNLGGTCKKFTYPSVYYVDGNGHSSAPNGAISRIYVRPNYKPQDATAPTISNVKVTDISLSGYTVTCSVSDNKGVTRVAFPTWTELNGQDDLPGTWPSVNVNSGANETKTVTFRVNASDHNNEKGVYITHIYAYDAAGNKYNVSQQHFPALRLDLAASISDSKKLKLPAKLTRIEEEAFLNTKAEAVVIPDTVKYIGSKAFPANMVVFMSTGVSRTVASDAMTGAYIVDTTKYSDWGAWSGWSRTRQSISNASLMQEESRTVYPYYCFECQTCGFHSPYWGSSANHNHTINSSDFRVECDNITTPKSGCTQYNSSKYETTYNGQKWYYWDDSSASQPYTQYRYRTRTVVSQ